MINTEICPSTPATIAQAAALLQAGQVVAFPTETVYGLAANAYDPAAVARIFAAKGRPATDPLIVHLADLGWLSRVCADVPPLARQVLAAFAPGPLTVIMPRHPDIPATVSAGLATVGVRIPAHLVALALLRAANLPLAAPSANLFAHTSPTTAQHVYADLKGRIPLILDGGPTEIGLESTIVDLSSAPPCVLRPGGSDLALLRALVPNLQVKQKRLTEAEAAPAPGMLLRHYAPRAPLHLYEGPTAALWAAMHAAADNLPGPVGFLLADEDLSAFAHRPYILSLGPASDFAAVARALFSGLRTFDDWGVASIVGRQWAADGLGLAIADRLLRAAEGRLTVVS
jgi:L-threonylcarbamoyladenylate synthase